MRPLAKDLTRSLEEVRNITRDQALRDLNLYTDRMRDALRHFDSLFAEFELRYMKEQTLLAIKPHFIILSRISWCKFAKNIQQSCDCHYIPLCFSSIASYVSAMVPVKSPKEYYVQQEVIVLFCETVERCVYRTTNTLI